jgi:NADPH:quinone reductase-like Zn-dependent oxidoreductase
MSACWLQGVLTSASRCRVGDAVFGQATGCLGTAVVADGRTLAPVPPQLGAARAAAAPTVFLTADACLRNAANLQRGQRVLIHAATGETSCKQQSRSGRSFVEAM